MNPGYKDAGSNISVGDSSFDGHDAPDYINELICIPAGLCAARCCPNHRKGYQPVLHGTSATNGTQEPANNIRFVVDLTDGTVTGFGIVSRVDRADDASISFSGKGPLFVRGMTIGTMSLTGEFDRVSGGLTVIATTKLPSSEAAKSYNYQLACKSR